MGWWTGLGWRMMTRHNLMGMGPDPMLSGLAAVGTHRALTAAMRLMVVVGLPVTDGAAEVGEEQLKRVERPEAGAVAERQVKVASFMAVVVMGHWTAKVRGLLGRTLQRYGTSCRRRTGGSRCPTRGQSIRTRRASSPSSRSR